jgi:hypothetical protein
MKKNKNFVIYFLLIVGFFLIWRIDLSPQPKKVDYSPNAVVSRVTPTPKSKIISVKYRNDPVNLNSGDFEYFPTSSSFVNGLWYDQNNQYMIILLNSTYYHYCGLPLTEWRSFKSAESYGTYYNQRIKGNYDCRNGYIPSY